MELIVQEVDCIVTDKIPDPLTTIFDDIGFHEGNFKNIVVYKRDKEVCPYNRGNWIADITFKSPGMVCIKLPLEMEEAAVLKYFSPIFEILKNERLQQMH